MGARSSSNPVASIGGVGHRKPPEGAGSHPATPVEVSPRLDLGGQPAIAAKRQEYAPEDALVIAEVDEAFDQAEKEAHS